MPPTGRLASGWSLERLLWRRVVPIFEDVALLYGPPPILLRSFQYISELFHQQDNESQVYPRMRERLVSLATELTIPGSTSRTLSGERPISITVPSRIL